MTGKAENIDLHLLYVDWKYSRCLRSIHDKEQSMHLCYFSDFRQIQQIPGHIWAMRADDRPGIFTDRIFHLFIRNASLFITLQNCQFCSFFFHFIQGTQNRVMFQCRCDNMIARIKESFDGKIQAFCWICSKRDLLRMVSAKKLYQFYSCIIDDPGRIQRRMICPSSCISYWFQCFHHSLHYLWWFPHRSCRIIQVNHFRISLPVGFYFNMYFPQNP